MGLYRSEKLHYLCHQIRSLLQLQLAFEKNKQTNMYLSIHTTWSGNVEILALYLGSSLGTYMRLQECDVDR